MSKLQQGLVWGLLGALGPNVVAVKRSITHFSPEWVVALGMSCKLSGLACLSCDCLLRGGCWIGNEHQAG